MDLEPERSRRRIGNEENDIIIQWFNDVMQKYDNKLMMNN